MMRRPFRIARWLIVSMMLLVAVLIPVRSSTFAQTDERDRSLVALRSGEHEAEAEIALAIDGPAGALAALYGGTTFPIRCGTLALATLDEQGPGSVGSRILAAASRPAIEDPRQFVAADGRYVIHYSGLAVGPGPDRDRNGRPDRLDRLAESIEAAHSELVDRLGFPSPVPERGTLDIQLAPLGHGLEGYAIGEVNSSLRLVLDAGLPADRLLPAVLHQMGHASLLRIVPGDRSFWSEATAAWLEVTVAADITGAADGLAARLAAPERPLADDGLHMMSGALLWPMFLSERIGDPSIVRQIWQEMATEDVDPIEAARRALARTAGLTRDGAFREFVGWTLFTGSRDDGLHFELGALMPESRLITLDAAPFQFDPSPAVGPLASLALRIEGTRREGALNLEIHGLGGAPAADLFALFDSEGPRRVLIPVPFDDDARTGRVDLPWGDVEELWIVLRNGSTTPGDGTRFQVRGGHDPYGPYDLASFTARPLGDALQLEWTTASENGLMGWNVQRAATPEGPFHRLNRIALPAFGDGDSEIGYLFVDESAERGRRYYYRLEGLTTFGLTDRSHVVSGRIPRRP